MILEQLLAVQERDCRIARLQKELKDIPGRRVETESRLEEHRGAVSEARESLKILQAEAKQIDLEIECQRQTITKLREQQMQLKTNKEFAAMETEIKAVQSAVTTLEDKELALMERIEAAAAQIGERDRELKGEDALVREDVATLEARVREIEADLEQVTQEREALARDADQQWLSAYDRIFRNKKDKGLVAVENGVCSGCHMKLPPYLCHEAKRRTAIVMCEFCGRMLY